MAGSVDTSRSPISFSRPSLEAGDALDVIGWWVVQLFYLGNSLEDFSVFQ